MSLVSLSKERSGKWWTRSGVIKCSERGGEIVGAPLRSHRLLCRTPPHKCGFLLMTVLLQDWTQSNSVLPVTKDTVSLSGNCSCIFYQLISEIILWLCFGPPSSGVFFFGPMPNLLADPWPICFQCTHYWDGCTKQRSAEIIWESMLCVCRCFRYSWWWTATWEGCSTLCVGIVSNVEISGGRQITECLCGPITHLKNHVGAAAVWVGMFTCI